MANNFKHTRTVLDTIKVKGVVASQNGETFITYEKDKEEYTVDVLDLFGQFLGEEVSFTITTKEETDLDE